MLPLNDAKSWETFEDLFIKISRMNCARVVQQKDVLEIWYGDSKQM